MGAGWVTLDAINTYTGSTIVGAGTLALGAGAVITNSAIINVRAGAIFDVTAPGSFSLVANRNLGGVGSVVGDVVAQNQSLIAPGSNAVAGTLIFSNNLSLNTGARLLFDVANNSTPGGGTIAAEQPSLGAAAASETPASAELMQRRSGMAFGCWHAVWLMSSTSPTTKVEHHE